MSRIYHSLGELCGHTPLFEPVRFEAENHIHAHLLCKLESYNPAGSIKDRAALNMIQNAEKDGIIKPGDTIVEQTSGNTGIALAAYAIPAGYHVDIFLEAGVTIERKKILAAYGCRLLDYRDIPDTCNPDDPYDPFREATFKEIEHYCACKGSSYHFLNQCTNINNPHAHMQSTGPEIFEQCDHKADALVCMAGTGGTILGLSTYFRKVNPDIYILSVQPDPVSRRSRENPYCHIIDGVLNFDDISEEDLCGFVHHDLYDECMNIVTEDAYKTAQAVSSKDGILFGTSGAAAFLAAVNLAKRQEFYDKNIIVIIPDGGDKYLSCPLYEY